MGNTDGDIKNEAKYKLNYSQHKTKQKSNKHVSTTTLYAGRTHSNSDLFTLIKCLGTVNQCENVGLGYLGLSQTNRNEVLIGKIFGSLEE